MIPNFTSPRLQKKIIHPSQPGGDWKLSWKKKKTCTIQKLQSLMCSKVRFASLGWYLGTRPFGGIIKERRFTSTCHTTKPTQHEGFRSQNYLQDSTKTHIICVFSHCTNSEKDYGVNQIIYLEYIVQQSSQCLSESKKKYTSTKLSAGGMPVSFSGSDLGRLKSHQSLRGSKHKKWWSVYLLTNIPFKRFRLQVFRIFLEFYQFQGGEIRKKRLLTRWIFPHFGPCP